MSLLCLKLVTGEEVIGEMVTAGDTSITMSTVAAIMMMGGQRDGQVGLGLMPFMPYLEGKEIEFKRDRIVAQGKPSVDMINNYNRLYGSGIEIASSLSM